MSVRSKFKVKKVRRVMKLESHGFIPCTFFVYKVTGPRGLKKYFKLRKQADAWIKQYTSTKVA